MKCQHCNKKEATHHRGGQHLCWKCKGKGKSMNDKGVFSYAILFVLGITLLLMTFAFLVPWGIQFTTAMYAGSEDLLIQAEQDANNIQDVNIRAAMLGSIQESQNTSTETVDLLSAAYRYSPFIIIFLLALMYFVFVRSSVQRGVY